MADFKQISIDSSYSIYNIVQAGKIGHESASGTLGEFSKHAVSNAVLVPYYCTKEDFESIVSAIPNRLVLLDLKEAKDVAHPHIKFLAEYITRSVKYMDFENESIKLVGPKFDKEEVDCFKTAKSVHYCTKKPALFDEARRLSSDKSLQKKHRVAELELADVISDIEKFSKQIEKNPISSYSDGIRERKLGLIEKRVDLEFQMIALNEQIKCLSETPNMETLSCCNVGAEECSIKATKMVAFDSLYDIDLVKLFNNATRIGVNEVFASVILPFGLLFVDQYFSDELNVTFRRDDEGFIMVHGGDMSNGYCHGKASTIMKLMENSFIQEVGVTEEVWCCEIIRSVAEICLIRFYKARETNRIVRKLLPPKFDKYCIILDPISYFSPFSTSKPIMVPEDKLERAVSYILRNKKPKEVIEDCYAYVQCMFMKVVVGNTELQHGGAIHADLEDALVLYALIEGGARKHNLGQAFKKSLRKSNSVLDTLFTALFEEMKTYIYEFSAMKTIIDFFTKSRCEKYIKERINLRDLILDSHKADPTSIKNYFGGMLNKYNRNLQSMRARSWSLYEFRNMWSNPMLYWERMRRELGDDGYLAAFDREKHYVYRSNRFCMRVYNRIIDEKNCKLNEENHKNIYRTVVSQFIKKERHDYEEELQLYKKVLGGCSDSDSFSDTTVGVTDINVNVDADSLPFDSHDPKTLHHLSEDPNKTMDDLTLAAFNFNLNRMTDGSLNKPYSKKTLAALVKKFTRTGKESKCVITIEQAKEALELLKDAYCVEASNETVTHFKDLKTTMFAMIKSDLKKGKYKNIVDKNIFILKGVSGAGKTFYMENNFEYTTDAYISPMASVLSDTNKALKKRFGSNNDYKLKTFEKISELPKSGKTLYIDESGAMSRPFLIFILTHFDYQKYVFLGDDEQSKHYDPTGILGTSDFTSLINYDDVTVMYFTFRFGPTVAAYLNTAFNYPVFSLKETDTVLSYKPIEAVNESMTGANIAVTTETVDHYIGQGISNIKTSKSSQGQTLKVTNVIYRECDIKPALAFRSNGIVASSRCSEELNVYIDFQSKKTKEKRNLTVMMDNYSAMFNVVVPNESDF